MTFYKSLSDLPPFDDYAMKGRTYRYFGGDSLYAFGFGMSYSKFSYSGLRTHRTAKGATVSVRVKNDSARDGDEVAQLYFTGGGASGDPIRTLRGFQRLHLRAGESRNVEFQIPAENVPKAKTKVAAGGGQPVPQIPHVDGVL